MEVAKCGLLWGVVRSGATQNEGSGVARPGLPPLVKAHVQPVIAVGGRLLAEEHDIELRLTVRRKSREQLLELEELVGEA